MCFLFDPIHWFYMCLVWSHRLILDVLFDLVLWPLSLTGRNLGQGHVRNRSTMGYGGWSVYLPSQNWPGWTFRLHAAGRSSTSRSSNPSAVPAAKHRHLGVSMSSSIALQQRGSGGGAPTDPIPCLPAIMESEQGTNSRRAALHTTPTLASGAAASMLIKTACASCNHTEQCFKFQATNSTADIDPPSPGHDPCCNTFDSHFHNTRAR